MLLDKEDVLNRWSEYIGELFKDNTGERPAIKKNTDGPPILKAEVEAAIRKMKRGKATGPDGIPIEIEVQKDLYKCFIDYSKAFDKVKHEKLFIS